MKITNVTIENFLGIGTAKISLQDKGLVLVQGQNLDDPSADSNGSGKSSMIDAVFWGLYGKTARGLGGDDVINRVIGKQCVVTIELEDGTQTAKITRWRKAKGFHKRSGVVIEINGSDCSGGTDALTQAEIDKVVGCSEQVFAAAVYAGQEAMPDIPSLTDRQLKSLIEEAAGIDLIEEAYVVAREVVRDAQEAQDKFSDALDLVRSSVERVEGQIATVEDDIEGWEKTRESRVKQATDEAAELKTRATDVKKEIADFDEKGINDQIKKIDDEISALDEQMQEIDKEIAGVSEENEKARKLGEDVLNARHLFDDATKTAKRIAETFKKQKSKFENVESQVGEPCGECGKLTTEEDLADVKANLKETLRELKETYEGARDDAADLKAKLEECETARDEFEAQRTDISAQQAQQRELTSKQRDLTSDKNKLSATLSELPRLKDRYSNLKERFDAKRQDIKKLKEEKNPHGKSLDRYKTELVEAQKAVEEKEVEYANAAEHLVVAKAAAQVFGPKGVRAHILDTVTPFLNDRTAHYLSTLSDGSLEAIWSTLTEGRDGELKEKFTIGVEKYGTGTFASLSGGEKRKVRLATTLALQDLVASRATKPINLWIGDEIDTALDPAGLERLMTLLEMKAREKGTVLIVSHHDLKDWVRDTVVVTMEDKAARVEGVLCPVP